MSKTSPTQLKLQKEYIANILTASNQFRVKVRMSAGLSVLKQLGISGRDLKRMGDKEFNHLYVILRQDLSVVAQEHARRAKRG